nr:DUF6449 domain-containing protein [Neobacillus sp. Marseille-Q6967]
MPSKTSWFNKELILQIGRSTGWISIVYFLGLFLTLPLRMLMMYSDQNRMDFNSIIYNLFYYDFPIQVGLMLIVPILLAVFLFRFLHVKQAADLMHSLPMTRNRIFHHYALTGVVYLVVPVTIITILVLIIRPALELQSVFGIEDVFYWAGITILIDLVLYAAGVFIAMMTGISAVQAVLSYVMLIFPVGITMLLFYSLRIFLYGFPSDYFLRNDLVKMSPLTYAGLLDESSPLKWSTALIYIGLTILLYVLALFFYKKRNLESASEAIAFPKLRSVFKYGVTFCTMLLAGMYFYQISNGGFGWTVMGYIIGAAIGYYVSEMVLKKTWRVFNQIKGLIVYSAVMTILIMAVQLLGIYENRVPNQDEIKTVILTDNAYLYLYQDGNNEEFYRPAPLSEGENIEAVRTLHEQIITDKTNNDIRDNENNRTFFFLYELENGRHVVREYRINMLRYQSLYKPIYESKEYKTATKEIFKINESKVKNIQIMANGPINKAVNLSDPKDIKQAISILREDVLAESYEDSLYYQYRGSTIEFNIGKMNYLAIEMKPSYTRFAEWLKEKNQLDQATVTGEDLSRVLVGKVELANLEQDPAHIKELIEEDGNSLEITETEKMTLALERASTDSRHEYAAVFYYNAGHHYEVYYFDEEHVPEFVSEHFQ